MEKRTILAIVLSLAVLMGYQYIFPPSKPVPSTSSVAEKVSRSPVATTNKPEAATNKDDSLQSPSASNESAVALPIKEALTPVVDGEDITIDSTLYTCVINTVGGVMKKFTLKNYRKDIASGSSRLEMVNVVDPSYFPLSGKIALGDQVFSDRRFVYQADTKGLEFLQINKEQVTLELRSPQESGMTLVKKYVFYPGEYYFDLSYELQDRNDAPTILSSTSLVWSHEIFPAAKKPKSYVYRGPQAYVDGKLFKQSKKQKKIKKMELDGTINWIGYTTKYFLAAIMPQEQTAVSNVTGVIEKPKATIVETGMKMGGAGNFRVFIGPKEFDYLKKFNLQLDKSVDFGWFGIIARPLVQLLKFFNRYLHNYGLAIILVTILIKLVFYPLSQKSYQSMNKMKAIQPKVAKMKEKYKDDKARQQKEMMDLYRTYKVNPFGGCLPIVVQIPVFFGLYRGLMVAIELRHAPFFWWIQDLAAKDPYYITPILMGATMFLQQKMSPTTGDAMQAKMMLFMPLIFTFMFLNFPAGLVLYWLVNNILSIGQQYMVMKKAEV
ncbi:MAG: membrane protein insertase YidC [Pseudomonadota bacterium]|nr:membrane protein insertase YidC [Pseudomonadota bacterium]